MSRASVVIVEGGSALHAVVGHALRLEAAAAMAAASTQDASRDRGTTTLPLGGGDACRVDRTAGSARVRLSLHGIGLGELDAHMPVDRRDDDARAILASAGRAAALVRRVSEAVARDPAAAWGGDRERDPDRPGARVFTDRRAGEAPLGDPRLGAIAAALVAEGLRRAGIDPAVVQHLQTRCAVGATTRATLVGHLALGLPDGDALTEAAAAALAPLHADVLVASHQRAGDPDALTLGRVRMVPEPVDGGPDPVARLRATAALEDLAVPDGPLVPEATLAALAEATARLAGRTIR